MKNIVKALVATSAIAFSSVSALAADVTLTISSWAPPTHGVNAKLWPRLIKEIEEVTDGRVTAEVKYGLASPPAQMDLVMDGAADMTWIFHGYFPGRFVATKMIELPGYEGNAEAAQNRLAFAANVEHAGMKRDGDRQSGKDEVRCIIEGVAPAICRPERPFDHQLQGRPRVFTDGEDHDCRQDRGKDQGNQWDEDDLRPFWHHIHYAASPVIPAIKRPSSFSSVSAGRRSPMI